MLKFIHNLSDVQSLNIGAGTRIWQYAIVLPSATIGQECNICSHCFIENDVVLGDRVTIKSGVQLWDGLRVGSDVFIGPNVSFTNDRFPRSCQRPTKFMETIIQDGASIGAGAVILPGISIGTRAMVGAGSVVTRSVPPNAIVAGNPAKIVGYVNANRNSFLEENNAKPVVGIISTKVKGVTIHQLPLVTDIRGSLTVGEFNRSIPFSAKRYFMVFDVPSIETRGEHAHHLCQQFLICIRGSCAVVTDDGINREEFILNKPDVGIYLPALTWGIQYKYTDDAVLLVFASDFYDDADYIRNYSDFQRIKGVFK